MWDYVLNKGFSNICMVSTCLIREITIKDINVFDIIGAGTAISLYKDWIL